MYPKKNNNSGKKESNNYPGDVSKEEIAAENDSISLFQSIGNEGMNRFLDSSFHDKKLRGEYEDNSIEMNDSEDDLMNSIEAAPELDQSMVVYAPKWKKINKSKKKVSKKNNDIEEGLIDFGNAARRSGANPPKQEQKKIKEAKKQEEEINKEKDPEKIIDKIPGDVADELIKAAPELDQFMIVHAPKWEKINKSKKKSSENNNDIEDVSDDMKPAEGFAFQPQKIAPRKKAGKGDRFLSGLAYYSGQTVGRLIGFVSNILYWSGLGLGPHMLFLKLSGKMKNKKKIDLDKLQNTRQHDQIPGWDGRKFEEQQEGEQVQNDPIKVDFRKIPGVWSEQIGADAEDESGEPLKPIITVYVSEPKEMHDELDTADIGHTYIGLEFSHFSKVTNRFERYDTKYGFFAPGGQGPSTTIAGFYHNATVPGQLLNDKDYGYTISQSFPAEPEQVNAIMKASETYADEGYRLFDRNCTTFVKEMVVDLAKIKAAEHILAPEEIRMSHLLNLLMFGSGGFGLNARLGMNNKFKEFGAQEDFSYERLGNKRYVKEEYDRYQETMKKGGGWQKYGMSPVSAAENMRRVKSPDAGLINSLNYEGDIDETNKGKGYNLHDLYTAYSDDAFKVNNLIKAITPEELMDAEKAPDEFADIYGRLCYMAYPFEEITQKIEEEYEKRKLTEAQNIIDYECITLAMIRENRRKIMGNIKDLNTLLFKYYQNDKRVHLPILHLIAILNKGVNTLDNLYRNKTKERKDEAGDLGNARAYMSEKINTVKAGGKTAVFSGTHYESYLQIFTTPEKAVANYARYLELNDREKRELPLSDAEKKELAKLKRTETLAKDFDNSHNYMLDKDRYRQQDIDYAFALGEKERQGGARGDLFERHRSASDVYKASILEKIFRGFKERITKSPEEGGMYADNIDPNELTNWLDEDMSTAAAKKMADMRMILIGLKKSLGETDQDSMFEAVQNLFEESWFPFVLPPGKGDDRIKTLALRVPHAFYQVMDNPEKKFPKLIQKLITMVLNEDKGDSLIELKKNANKRAGAAKPA